MMTVNLFVMIISMKYATAYHFSPFRFSLLKGYKWYVTFLLENPSYAADVDYGDLSMILSSRIPRYIDFAYCYHSYD